MDRASGKKLGVRLGNAAGPGQPIPIIYIEPTGQAQGKLVIGDTVVAINDNSVLGFEMKEAAQFVVASDKIELVTGPHPEWGTVSSKAVKAAVKKCKQSAPALLQVHSVGKPAPPYVRVTTL